MEKGLTKSQLATELNEALKSNGINSDLFYISPENTNMFQPDGKTSEKLESAIEQLNKVQDKVDYLNEWFDKEHTKDQLVVEIKTSIDINSTEKFLSPKLSIDLNSFIENKMTPSSVQTQISKEIVDIFKAKLDLIKLGTLNSKYPKPIGDNMFKFEGATFRYIVGEDGEVYSMSNERFEKIQEQLKTYPDEAKEQILSKTTKRGKNFFKQYEESLDKVAKLEAKIEADFLLKNEYDSLVELDDYKQFKADEQKPC